MVAKLRSTSGEFPERPHSKQNETVIGCQVCLTLQPQPLKPEELSALSV